MNSFLDMLIDAHILVNIARAEGDANKLSKALGLQSSALEAYTWSINLIRQGEGQ